MLRPLAGLTSVFVLIVPSFTAAETTAVTPAQFIASLTVSEIAADGTCTELTHPKIRYVAGRKCSMTLAAKGGKQFFFSVRHGGNDTPDAHIVSMKLTEAGTGGKPRILAAPQLVVSSGRAGTIFIGQEPGPAIEISVLVEAVDEDR